MILFCRYGSDTTTPETGFVIASYEDANAPTSSAHPDTVAFADPGPVERFGRFGPEPELMGDPPTVPGAKDERRRAEDYRPWAAPPITAAVLKAYLANLRYEREITGLTVGDIPVATDRDSQAAIEKLASRAARDATYKPTFKGADGLARSIDAATMISIGDHVSDFVDALRAREAEVAASVDEGKITTFDAVAKALDA